MHNELRRMATGAPSRPLRVLLPVVAVTLCFCAVCVLVLLDARRAAWERYGDAAASLATAIESDLARNIETLNQSLLAAVDNLKYEEIERASPGLRHRVLFDR